MASEGQKLKLIKFHLGVHILLLMKQLVLQAEVSSLALTYLYRLFSFVEGLTDVTNKKSSHPWHDLINFSLRLFLSLILHCFLLVVTIHYDNEG